MSHHVSIFGQGVHAQRYMDAFLFYPEIGDIEQISSGQTLSPNSDIAVLSEPFMADQHLMDTLTDHSNLKWILCEKLPYKDSVRTREMIDSLGSKGLYFIHTRCYEPTLLLPAGPNIRIEWPNIYETGMDPLWNTLPNILDWLMRQAGELPSVESTSLVQNTGDWYFSTCLAGVKYEATIIPAGEQAMVTINGVPQRWPHYLQAYHSALDQILGGTVLQAENHRHTLAVIDLINEMINRKDLQHEHS